MRKLRYKQVKELSQSIIVEARCYPPYPAAGFLVPSTVFLKAEPMLGNSDPDAGWHKMK